MIQSIAEFKKPLFAAVTGRVIGIGVSILPLFDVVFAHENSTFEIPSSIIGQVPEGISVLANTSKISPNLVSNQIVLYFSIDNFIYGFLILKVSELLYMCEKVPSQRALQRCLVTKVLKADNFDKVILSEFGKMAARSSQVSASLFFLSLSCLSKIIFLPCTYYFRLWRLQNRHSTKNYYPV